jgi:hypothetical protein
MKITNDKNEDKLHVYAKGKGKDVEIRMVQIPRYSCEKIQKICLDITECKEFMHHLKIAIDDGEKRSTMKDDEDE